MQVGNEAPLIAHSFAGEGQRLAINRVMFGQAEIVHAYRIFVAKGVVDAKTVAAFATQSGMGRHAGSLAKNVQQRHVYR